jgi:hypothetical protein
MRSSTMVSMAMFVASRGVPASAPEKPGRAVWAAGKMMGHNFTRGQGVHLR